MRISLKQLSRRRRQAGVTLIEALVSMGVFGISFFSLYAGMSMGFSVIGNARENLRATQIMVEKMETIRLYSWDQINTPGFIPETFSESYFPAPPANGDGATTMAGGEATEGGTVQTVMYQEDGEGSSPSNHSSGVIYDGQVTIGNGPGGHTYSADLRRVRIALTWTSGGRTHNRSMVTYISRNGLQNYIY